MGCLHSEQILDGPWVFCTLCGLQMEETRVTEAPLVFGEVQKSTHNRRAYFQKALELRLGLPLGDLETEKHLHDLVETLRQSGVPLGTRKEVRRMVKTKLGKKYITRICVLLGHKASVLKNPELLYQQFN